MVEPSLEKNTCDAKAMPFSQEMARVKTSKIAFPIGIDQKNIHKKIG